MTPETGSPRFARHATRVRAASALWQQLISERLGREVPADAGGGVGVGDQQDCVLADVELPLKSAHELVEATELRRGGDRAVEVADETNADEFRIDLLGAG